MTLMKSGHPAKRFPTADLEPVGRGQRDGVLGQHAGQAGEHVGEVFLGIDAKAAAVFHDGVEDGALLTGHLIADEQPVFRTKFGRTNRVFHEIVADFDPAVAKVDFEVGPLVDGVADGFAEFAFGQNGTPQGEFVDGFPESPVDHAALGGAHGFAQGRAGLGFAQALFDVIEVGDLAQDPGDEPGRLFGGLEKLPPHVGMAAHEFDPCLVLGPGWIDNVAIALDDAQQWDDFGIDWLLVLSDLGFLKQSVHAAGIASVMPVVEHAAARNVRRPEITGLRFAAAGFEVFDGGFVNLSVKCPPMFVLDFPVNDGNPVGGEQGPVAEGFAMEGNSHPGEHFLLPVVGQVADKAVVDHLGDEGRSGDAAVLQGSRQRADDGFGGGVVLADVFAAHDLDAEELGGFEAELLAHFLADAPVAVGIKQDFGRIEFLANLGKVFRDTCGAGLFGSLLMGRDFSRRSWVCGNGGGSFFCEIASEHEFELGGIELLAGLTEDPAAERVDALFEDDDFGGLARDDLVALRDLVKQALFFVFHITILIVAQGVPTCWKDHGIFTGFHTMAAGNRRACQLHRATRPARWC